MTKYLKYDIIVLASGPVVQLVRTLACHARGRRFDPVPDRLRTLSCEGVQIFADIAQSAERVLGKDEVVSSSLIISSIKIKRQAVSENFGNRLFMPV